MLFAGIFVFFSIGDNVWASMGFSGMNLFCNEGDVV